MNKLTYIPHGQLYCLRDVLIGSRCGNQLKLTIMDNIIKISIVCSTGAEVYQVGYKNHGKVVSEIQRISGYEDTSGMVFPGKFLVKDEDGNNIAEISDIVPYVIDFA